MSEILTHEWLQNRDTQQSHTYMHTCFDDLLNLIITISLHLR